MTQARRKAGVFPVLTEAQQEQLKPELRTVIEYRKSGLSLNHVVGCPLDCAYCVRHLFDNYQMKVPRALMSDEQAVEALVGHPYFQPHLTPVQLFNRATDPMLPQVKPHTFRVLRLLCRFSVDLSVSHRSVGVPVGSDRSMRRRGLGCPCPVSGNLASVSP